MHAWHSRVFDGKCPGLSGCGGTVPEGHPGIRSCTLRYGWLQFIFCIFTFYVTPLTGVSVSWVTAGRPPPRVPSLCGRRSAGPGWEGRLVGGGVSSCGLGCRGSMNHCPRRNFAFMCTKCSQSPSVENASPHARRHKGTHANTHTQGSWPRPKLLNQKVRSRHPPPPSCRWSTLR